jgi:hypothetical protein
VLTIFIDERANAYYEKTLTLTGAVVTRATPLGLGAGGSIVQHIERDRNDPRIWDVANSRIINIQLLDARSFQLVTGLPPPDTPITVETYSTYGFPFFQVWRDEKAAVGVSGDWGWLAGAAETAAMNAKKRHKSDAVSAGVTTPSEEDEKWGLLSTGAWGRLDLATSDDVETLREETSFTEADYEFPVVLLHVDDTVPKFKSVNDTEDSDEDG